jgi:hypothetical protein
MHPGPDPSAALLGGTRRQVRTYEAMEKMQQSIKSLEDKVRVHTVGESDYLLEPA